jgi:hypothetical protein
MKYQNSARINAHSNIEMKVDGRLTIGVSVQIKEES